MAALGLTYREIGHQLGISEQTVKRTMTDVHVKLGVPTTIDCFRVLGWLTVPDEHASHRPPRAPQDEPT